MAGGCKRVDEIRSHLIAARTDARSDRGDDVLRTRPEFARHGVQRRDRGASRRTAPAGMHSGNSSRRTIGHQDRNTVRRADSDSHTGDIGDENVCFRRLPRRR